MKKHESDVKEKIMKHSETKIESNIPKDYKSRKNDDKICQVKVRTMTNCQSNNTFKDLDHILNM